MQTTYKTITCLAIALTGSMPAVANIDFSSGPADYNNSAQVITPTTGLTATSNQIYIRDPRATLQTFQVADSMELSAVNLLIRRAMEGAQFTISLRDFGTTAPAGTLNATLSGSTELASYAHTVTAAQVFGNNGGPVTAADPFNTMTWSLASSVTLAQGNYYGVVFEGTNVTSGTPHIIIPYALSNVYAGGLGYYQTGNAVDFVSGDGIFGSGNDQQVDFALALVPEPSTYALMLGALAIGVVLIRRRAN